MKRDDKWLLDDDRFVCQVYERDPVIISGGDGVFLFDSEHKRYLDFSAQYSSCTLGHGNQELTEAIEKQLSKLVSVTAQFATTERVKLAGQLIEITNGNFGKVLFGCTGSDANEFALKAAKYYGGGGAIVSLWRGYHGATAGSAAATGKAETIQTDPLICRLLPEGFIHVAPPYCYRCDYDKNYPDCNFFCVDYIKRNLTQNGIEKVAAFILEPIQASGGVIVPPQGYFERIRSLCDEMGALLIFDEVVTGFGRTGTMCAYQQIGVVPDMLVLGKGMTGGYIPGSAVLMREDVGKKVEELTLHGHTHSAYPLMCAAASKNIDILIENSLCKNVTELGYFLIDRLNKLKDEYEIIGDVRGRGLLTGIEFVESGGSSKNRYRITRDVYDHLLEHGVITEIESSETLGSSVIVLHPPLTIEREHIERFLDMFEEALRCVSNS